MRLSVPWKIKEAWLPTLMGCDECGVINRVFELCKCACLSWRDEGLGGTGDCVQQAGATNADVIVFVLAPCIIDIHRFVNCMLEEVGEILWLYDKCAVTFDVLELSCSSFPPLISSHELLRAIPQLMDSVAHLSSSNPIYFCEIIMIMWNDTTVHQRNWNAAGATCARRLYHISHQTLAVRDHRFHFHHYQRIWVARSELLLDVIQGTAIILR